MNVVRHGTSSELCYDIECRIEKDRFIILVSDCCGGFNIEKYSEPCLEDPKENGMGIFIIRALMDEVDIYSKVGEGTKIKMVKYIL